MRVIKPRPPDLTTLLFDLGPRTLVLVEGDSDCAAFEEWYQERLGEVMFHVPGGGSSGVQSRLEELLALSSHKRVFGIIDRDFRTDAEVEKSLNDPAEHLFILRRYALENYLLEPKAIQEELRVFYGPGYTVPDGNTIRDALLRLCQELLPLMAANWALLENALEYFATGYDLSDRKVLVQQIAGKLGCNEAEAETRLTEKETLLASAMANLETAHTCINGKHLLHKAYQLYIVDVKKGLVKDHLCRLLVRTVKQLGVHTDIRAIIEDRILA